MRLDRFISLRIARPLQRETGQSLPILMYHSICDDPEPGVGPYYRIATSPEIFRRQMNALRSEGYRGVDLQTGIHALKNGFAKNKKLAAITFDDGYRDFYTNAFAILREFGFTATMYLPTAFIGTETRTFKSRACLTWSEVKELRSAGIHFGSHTVNHPKLAGLDWPHIKTELADSKKEIENQLGGAADAFAYPFAFPETRRDFAARFRETLVECGYTSCCTTRVGRARPGDDLFQLKRLPANSGDDDEFFRAKLEGAYDWIAPVQFGVKKMKSIFPGRAARRDGKTGAQGHCQHA